MKIVKITNNIFQFHFFDGDSEFSFNITAILDRSMAILIDTAYQRHVLEVKKYLSDNGIDLYKIFISHHHEDHFDGVKCFTDSEIYASDKFKEDYQDHLQSDDFLKNFYPNIEIKEGAFFKFGNHVIKCFETPGHNKCSVSYLINNNILHVGDLIFSNKDGKPSIPYIDTNSNTEEYLTSLKKIEELNLEILLTGHGEKIINKETINKLVQDYKYYLIKLSYNHGRVNIEDCLRRDKSNYSGLQFHESNLENIHNL